MNSPTPCACCANFARAVKRTLIPGRLWRAIRASAMPFWLSRQKLHASDQHLHALSILQGVQSSHRVGKRGDIVAGEPKGIGSLFREFRPVVNNDNAGRQWCILADWRFSPSKDGCLLAIECGVDKYRVSSARERRG